VDTSLNPKRYAIVGTGVRSKMFFSALLDTHADVGELVALCDSNATRMAHYGRLAQRATGRTLPAYAHTAFDTMIRDTRPDVVIVTTVDRTHHTYIIRAMELGCDVITEKPLTIDAERCQRIVDAVHRTGRDLRVAFNYRYAPANSTVKALLQAGTIGAVTSVHFEWLLDTVHGADYFRRWHRDKRNSGGLMVHKSTHHFDLVNWWLDSSPATVFGMGDLRFYGRENAEERGVTAFYERAHGSDAARHDPFAIDLAANPELRSLYLEAEHEDGYHRDQSVFGDGISIEDTMAVLVRYENRALLTYSLTAYAPWEGFRAMFNGTQGRLEVDVCETSYVSGSRADPNLPGQRHLDGDGSSGDDGPSTRIRVQRHWQRAEAVPFEQGTGGHGGGDVRLLDDLFRPRGQVDPLGRAAGYLEGARSILTGIAANRSFETGRPVSVGDLVRL